MPNITITAKPEVFARARVSKGWSQRELAKRSGYSHAYISMLERSLKSVGPKAAKKLAEMFGIELEELFDVEYKPNK